MPYCTKCGAELKEDAKFCHVCGAPVGVMRATTYKARRMRTPALTAAIVLGSVLIVALIVGVLGFLPVRNVSFSPPLEVVPSKAGINVLNLTFNADNAQVDIVFEKLVGRLMTLNVSATGGVGVLAPQNPIEVSFNYSSHANVMMVDASVNRPGGWPWSYGLNSLCDIRIDPSASLSLDVRTSVGKIEMNTTEGLVFKHLHLESSVGEVEASLVQHVIVDGDVVVQTTTGGVKFAWKNVDVRRVTSVSLRTTTGAISSTVTQNNRFAGNVTMNVEAVTGAINHAIVLGDGVGAKIDSSTTVGGVSVNETGFSGTETPIQSENYPAICNFDIVLRTTTGGIQISAAYMPGSSEA